MMNLVKLIPSKVVLFMAVGLILAIAITYGYAISRFNTFITDLAIISDTQRSTIQAETNRLMWQVVGISVITKVVVLGCLWFMVWKLCQPIQFLNKAVTQISNQDFSVQLAVKSDDELGRLTTNFNSMVDKLRYTHHLTETYLKKLPAPVMGIDWDWNILYINERAAEFVNTTPEAVIGKKCYDLFQTGHCHTPECRVRQAMEQETTRVGRTVSTGAGNIPIQYTASPVRDMDGNVIGGIEEIADITELTQTLDSQQDILTQTQTAILEFSAAATEIQAATAQQMVGANQQSTALQQTSLTIDQVKTITEQSLAKAKQVAEQAQATNTISQDGSAAITNIIDSMALIKEQVTGIADNIEGLREQTQQISEIIATVNEIANQSNLLALNASIEAARAGEHGKGFAVVAVEVRNLAEQSRQATAQVKTILNDIQQATNQTVAATEIGISGVDDGVHLVQQAGQTIQQLVESIKLSADTAQQIVASVQQQNAGMEQITIAMQDINQAMVQSLASTHQTEQSIQDLSGAAKQLELLVHQYQM